MGVESYHFEELIENYKLTKGVLLDTELDEEDWDGLIKDFKNTVKEKPKKIFLKMFINNYLVQLVQCFYHGKVIEQKFTEVKSNTIRVGYSSKCSIYGFGNMGNDYAQVLCLQETHQMVK